MRHGSMIEWWEKEQVAKKIEESLHFCDEEARSLEIRHDDIDKILSACSPQLAKYTNGPENRKRVQNLALFYRDAIKANIKQMAILMALCECARKDAVLASDSMDFGDFYDELQEKNRTEFENLCKTTPYDVLAQIPAGGVTHEKR